MYAGAAATAAVALALPVAHLAAVLLVPLMVASHLLAVRLLLVGDAVRLLGRRRRLFNRWLTRLAFLWVGGLGYGLGTAPLIGVVPAVGVFLALTAAAHHYTLWGLRAERDRRSLTGWEKLSFGCVGLLTLAVLLLAVLLLAAVGWSLSHVVSWLDAVR